MMPRIWSIFYLCAVCVTPVFALDTSTLPVQESNKYIPNPKTTSLDQLAELSVVAKPGMISSCKDMILRRPPIPNDADVNLIYMNVYTFCMMQAVLRTFLDTHADTEDSAAKQEIMTALTTLSTFLPALLSSYYYAIPAFQYGLRNKITEEGQKVQQEYLEPPHLPLFSN